jgi:hypothetical protein
MLKQRYLTTGCLLLLVVFLLCGCEIASIEEPVGEPWSLKETKAMEGHWLDIDGNPLELVAVSKGEVRMGSCAWDSDKKVFVAKTESVHFRHLGMLDLAFLEVPFEPKVRYTFAKIQVREDGAILWRLADEKLLLDAVLKGKLTGVQEKIEDRKEMQLHLKCSGDEFAKWISETGEDLVFPKVEYESEMIFTKAKKREGKDPGKK